jgi:hypothetical protein
MRRTKRCPRCGTEKPLDAFSKNKAGRDGLQSSCKDCRKVIVKNWREKHPERAKQSDDKYRKKHREERREYNRQWRQKNATYWRSYQNNRLHTDIEYRLRNYMGVALRRAIRKNRKSTFAILGYSVEELCLHLEALFQAGMSWQNYGTHWHIDHVIPKSWFKLHDENGIDEYEFKLCWSLQNLQPMWTEENLEKKDRHIHYIHSGPSPVTFQQFRNRLEQAKRNQFAMHLS